MNCKRVTHVIVVKSRGKSVDVSPTFSVRGLWKVNINKALSPQTSSPFSSLLTVVHCDDNFTLPSITDQSNPAPEVAEALMVLSADTDGGVRDWATFGLAELLETDSPEVRAALTARLDDLAAIADQARAGLVKRSAPGG